MKPSRHQHRRPGRRPTGARSAQTALEFALVLPVVLLLLAAIADFGWYFSRQILVDAAADDAARSSALTAADAVEAAARDLTLETLDAQGFDPDTATVSVVLFPDEALSARVLEVNVLLPFDPLVGLTPSPDTLETTARFPHLSD